MYFLKLQHIYKVLMVFSYSERCAAHYTCSKTKAFEKYVTLCMYCTATFYLSALTKAFGDTEDLLYTA